MIRKYVFGLAVAGFASLGLLASTSAFAASDVSNSGAEARQATTAVAAPIASSQTASLIGSAISSGIGGFSGGGAGGGFAPSGGTGGGFAPSGGQTSSLDKPMGNTTTFANSREQGRAAGNGDKRWGAWMMGAYTAIENTQAGLQMDGSVYNLVGGLDYAINDRVVVGVSVGYESLDLDTAFNRGTVENDGFSVIPYVGIALNNTWSVDLAGGMSWLNYDVSRAGNTVTGAYDAERWLVSANLNGNYGFGRLRVLPKIGVLYLEEESDGYRESTGANVAGGKTKLGRLSAGGKVGYAFDSVMPFVKLIGEYDFD